EKTITIGIVGKYTILEDSYLSIVESLKHAGIANRVKIDIRLIASQTVTTSQIAACDGLIVPGGFGDSGIEGKIKTITYARENNIPFLGICLGMQLAVIEFANNVCDLKVVHGEFNPKAEGKIIDILEGQDLKNLGGKLRLGDYKCNLKESSLAHDIYKSNSIVERHRHRYEFNNDYREILQIKGMAISGTNKKEDLVEIIELPTHKFFIGVQFHPELTSKLTEPNPLFVNLVKSCINKQITLI
ncbi:MAG: gamma-glutamyl-gamma-aminobutyrate hydrolase family protein, partial [Spiroplasma sp.]|nr:gamma-glutamyl-gamma-aminobutyrate hydrolase family protein [Mycoplasmatales bacterium]